MLRSAEVWGRFEDCPGHACYAELGRTPLGRLGEPQDIANAILFLSSAAASWITPPVDCGYTVSG